MGKQDNDDKKHLPYRIRIIANHLTYLGYEVVPKEELKHKIRKNEIVLSLLLDEMYNYLKWMEKRKTKKEKLKELCELDEMIIEDYLKLLKKHYLKEEHTRKKHSKEQIISYFNKIKHKFNSKKGAILATANHFDITTKAVEKHLYTKK